MSKIDEALRIIIDLGLPKAQHNERTAFCLLALLNLTEDTTWSAIERPLIGITPIMDFARDHYKATYAPNSRESIRRQSIHQLVDAGIALINPDDPKRPPNSPKTVYQIEEAAHELLSTFGEKEWTTNLKNYLESIETLSSRYANEREMQQVPVKFEDGQELKISPGVHSLLIKAIIEDFASRFVPGGDVIYVGDTGKKWVHFNKNLLSQLGVTVDFHGKMPDVILFYPAKNWLLLIESVTSHGPVDGKRHAELAKLFNKSEAPLVYVTAFPSRSIMASYLPVISWETEVWCADAPTHLIHFNGVRFLGPYPSK